MPKETRRYTVDLSPAIREKLGELADWNGSSESAVVRETIDLMHYIAKEVRAGGEVFINRPGKKPVALARIEILFK